MRSLVITPMLPVLSPQDAGGKHRRAGAFIRALGRVSDRVDLVYIVPEHLLGLAANPAALNESQSAFWSVPLRVSLVGRRRREETLWSYYGAGIFDAAAQPGMYPFGGERIAAEIGLHLDAGPDLVFVDRIDAMLPILRSGRRPKATLLDVDDVYHKVLWRTAFSRPARVAGWAGGLQAPALILAERRAVAMSSLAFVCSATDCRHLRRLGFGDKVRFLPNAVAVPDDPPPVTVARSVLFLGSFHHPPNAIAAERLVRRIWPIVRGRVPDASLLIAGADSDRLPSFAMGAPGVNYLGFVDDLPALYARSRLVCCPISTGSGTRLKLVEAASFARPMVSTRVGAEGLDFRDGSEILLRDDDAGLAEACIALLEDDALCQRLGRAGWMLAKRLYEVSAVEQQIALCIQEARAGVGG